MGNAHISPAQQYSPLGEALVDIEKGPEPPVKAPEEREAAETQLVQELWFNELMDAVGDVTNMVSIVRDSNLAAVYGLYAVLVCATSLCSFLLSLAGRSWLRKTRKAVITGDPRAEEKDKTEHGMERWAQDHDEEPKYARLEWWGAA